MANDIRYLHINPKTGEVRADIQTNETRWQKPLSVAIPKELLAAAQVEIDGSVAELAAARIPAHRWTHTLLAAEDATKVAAEARLRTIVEEEAAAKVIANAEATRAAKQAETAALEASRKGLAAEVAALEAKRAALAKPVEAPKP